MNMSDKKMFLDYLEDKKKRKKSMARYRKRRKGLKLTVRKGRRKWTLKTLFKSKASRMRAKRGLATRGWR